MKLDQRSLFYEDYIRSFIVRFYTRCKDSRASWNPISITRSTRVCTYVYLYSCIPLLARKLANGRNAGLLNLI